MAAPRPTRWHWIDWLIHDALVAVALIATAALIADVMITGAG